MSRSALPLPMQPAPRTVPPRAPGRSAAALCLIVAAAPACRREPAATTVQGGGGLQTGSLWLSNGDLVVWENGSGVAFGQVAKPGQARELSYFVVVRSGGGGSPLASSSSGENDGRRGSSRQSIAAGDRRVEIRHAIDLAEVGGKLRAAETLQVAGAPRAVEAGRLFLVDLRASPTCCEQVQASLPVPGAELSTTASVEAFARQALAKLGAEIPAVRELLQ